MARAASPQVGVGGRHGDAVGVGPVVVQAFPDAARAFGDVGLRAAQAMHLHVIVGAVAEELRAPGAEVCQPGDVLLGGQGGCVVEVNGRHACSLQREFEIRISNRSLSSTKGNSRKRRRRLFS